MTVGKRIRQKESVASSRRPLKTASIIVGIVLVVAIGIGVAMFAGRSDDNAIRASQTSSRLNGSALPVVDVYKDPTCGCCSKWVEHLQDHGFTVRTADTRDLAAFKASHGVPSQVRSCHTALVDGYVLEGHVPAADVRRLLSDRPSIVGLAVPGMPIGSPGMEVVGARAQAYDVLAFDKSGGTHVFAAHR